MARHIHFHFHTRDAGEWKEGDHPRAQNGEFGTSGSGGAEPHGVRLKGDELGDYSSMKELRQKALDYAKRFIGKSFTNKATGNDVQVTTRGVKHTLAGSSDGLARTVPAIPELLENGKLIGVEKDKRGDPNVLGVETYKAPIVIDGKERTAIMKVKQYRDGRRYYDHGLVE